MTPAPSGAEIAWNPSQIRVVKLTAEGSRAKAWLVSESPVRPVVEVQRTSGVRIRPTAVEIDHAAIADNARAIAKLAGTALCAVVKADAYGHGAPAVTRALEASGAVDCFAVSLVEEGVQLRDAGVRAPVLVMGPAQAGGIDEMAGRGLIPVVSSPDDLEELAAVVARRREPVAVHVKVDTGMGRLGLEPAILPEALTVAAASGVAVVGLMTHLANADVEDPADPEASTWRQLECFDRALAQARAVGAPIRVVHAANSSGTMMFPAARRDLVRVGLAMYGNGAWDSDGQLVAPRRQAMRLVSHVAQLRRVEVGGRVGYGGLWTAARPTLVAVVPVGYADGVPRRLTGRGEVIVAGRRCPLVGAVSMDMIIADVTDLAGVEIGDEAVVLGTGRGRYGTAHISTAEFAGWAGVSAYEVTCGISKRVPRVAA